MFLGTVSSVLIYTLLNPPTELTIKAQELINFRLASEKAIVAFAANGHIPTRKDLMDMHRIIEKWPDRIDDYELFENLEDGLYTRELHMPKDVIVVGKIHKYPYHVSILKGKCRLLSEYYNKIVEAPMTFTLPAGIKHIVYNIEDTVWSDVHTGTWDTIEEAGEEIFAANYEELDKFLNIVNERII